MRHLFRSLFGHEKDKVCYPDSFIKDAIERTVDSTDPCFRALTGYRRILRPVVVQSLSYVADLIDGLPKPLRLDPSQWCSDPRLHAFFVDESRLKRLLSTPVVTSALAKKSNRGSAIYGLLRMEIKLQSMMGVDRVNGVLTQGVKQTLVSFLDHQLVDLLPDEGEVRRHLKQRAFDHLLRLALDRLAMASSLREELEQRATLLNAKMNLLKEGQWGLDLNGNSDPLDPAELTEQLEEIQVLLDGVGDQTAYLKYNLELIVEMLGTPQEYLWLKERQLRMDRDGILRPSGFAGAPEFTVQQAQNSEGQSIVVALVEIPSVS